MDITVDGLNLLQAARRDEPEVVRRLLLKGVDVNLQDVCVEIWNA